MQLQLTYQTAWIQTAAEARNSLVGEDWHWYLSRQDQALGSFLNVLFCVVSHFPSFQSLYLYERFLHLPGGDYLDLGYYFLAYVSHY